MSALHESLEALRATIGTLPTRAVFPPPAARETHRAMLAIFRGATIAERPLPGPRLAQVRQLVKAAGSELHTLPTRVIRDAAWLLAERPPVPGLAKLLAQRVATDARLLRRVIDAWLLAFDAGDPALCDLGHSIGRALGSAAGARMGAWRDVHATFALFDAGRGPTQVARAMLLEGPFVALAAARLDDPMRARSRIMRAVQHDFGPLLANPMSGRAGAAVLSCAEAAYAPGGALRFDELRANGAMADALVAPWLGGPAPDAALREAVLAFLRLHLGDPRVEPAKWAEASEATRQTVRGWLSRLSLEAFFKVIGDISGSSGLEHWPAREAFWSDVLERGHITDSWLVLGENVQRAIRGNRDLAGSYARLEGAQPNHSVLLMRVGKLLLAEWSHNGKLRAWPIDGQNVPPLFQQKYSASILRAGCLQFPPPRDRPELPTTDSSGLTHHQTTWQGRVRELLRRREKIELSP